METITPFQFFTTVFRGLRRPGRILVRSVVRRSGLEYSDWCHTPHQAAGRVERYRLSREVFFGVAVQDRGRALADARRRDPEVAPSRLLPGAGSAILLPALWAELVWRAEPRCAGPPAAPELSSLFEVLPRPPSILLRLGHDLHAYWLLADPLELEGDDDRRRASLLLRKLRWALASSPAAAGWRIDHGGGLGGLMRVAGTFLERRGRRLPVVVERFPEIRGAADRWHSAELEALPEPPPEPSPEPPPKPAAGPIVAAPGERPHDAALHGLVDGLDELLAVLGGRATTGQLIAVLTVSPPRRFGVLRSALRRLVPGLEGGVPTALQLGCVLRSHRGRAAGGRAIVRAGSERSRAIWEVHSRPTAARRRPATAPPTTEPQGGRS